LQVTIHDLQPNPVLAGHSYSYLVTVSNAGPLDAEDVHLVGNLGDGSTLDLSGEIGPAGMPGFLAAGTQQTLTVTRDTPSLKIDNVPRSVSVTDSFTVSDASQNDFTPKDDIASITETVLAPEAELNITIHDLTPSPVLAGQSYSYQVTVTNAGPQDAENVQL